MGSAAGGWRPDGRRHHGPTRGLISSGACWLFLADWQLPVPPPFLPQSTRGSTPPEPSAGDLLSDLEISKIHLAELSTITEWEEAVPKASVSKCSLSLLCVVCEVLKGFYFVCIYLFILLVLRLSASIFWVFPKGTLLPSQDSSSFFSSLPFCHLFFVPE